MTVVPLPVPVPAYHRSRCMDSPSVLVVDDDADVRGLVRELLERAGYAVLEAEDGRAGLRVVWSTRPDLVVLDVTLPGLDGWQVLERLREVSDLPVLMLTARSGELEKVRGLRGGADDYMTKPFGRQELVARVDALLRRSRPGANEAQVYSDGVVTVDFAQRAVTVDGESVALTPLEFRLLAALVRHANQVLSREQLLELVWDDPHGVSRSQVKLYISYLRRKLAGPSGGRELVETVRGFGYRYRAPAA